MAMAMARAVAARAAATATLAAMAAGVAAGTATAATAGNVPMSDAVVSDRPSAVAAASHSLLVEMKAPPQDPLSIM
eukprot:scaffold3105_cov49-Phaeocystis_antarctica.AAC.1